jgi:hypothetical protein
LGVASYCCEFLSPVYIREKAVRYTRIDGCTMAEWLFKGFGAQIGWRTWDVGSAGFQALR